MSRVQCGGRQALLGHEVVTGVLGERGSEQLRRTRSKGRGMLACAAPPPPPPARAAAHLRAVLPQVEAVRGLVVRQHLLQALEPAVVEERLEALALVVGPLAPVAARVAAGRGAGGAAARHACCCCGGCCGCLCCWFRCRLCRDLQTESATCGQGRGSVSVSRRRRAAAAAFAASRNRQHRMNCGEVGAHATVLGATAGGPEGHAERTRACSRPVRGWDGCCEVTRSIPMSDNNDTRLPHACMLPPSARCLLPPAAPTRLAMPLAGCRWE